MPAVPLCRRHRAVAAVAAATVAAITASVTAPPASAAVPKTRVYVVAIDSLSPDEVALMPFLSSLASTGSYYPESRAVMVAETIPNHVAMVTGVYPDRNGIVGNNYPDTAKGMAVETGDPALLQADSMFTLVQKQCPTLTTAAVTSKDYLYTVLNHDRTGDKKPDADVNFANLDDPTFIPGAGLTPDERTITEATRVSRDVDPDFLFVNLGSVDRVGHVDETGSVTSPLPTGSRPVARDVQRTLTDGYLRLFVEQLKQAGRWDRTALIVTADHSMNWSLPTSTVSLSAAFNADPLLKDSFVVAQNGGAGLYSLKDRAASQAAARLARMRKIATANAGVDEALYRQPNALDGGQAFWVGKVHPDWRQTQPRSGDLLVTVKDGRRITEPSATSNPIPGNHGMASTLRIPVIVNGGIGVVQKTLSGTSADPGVRAASQAENVDMAPTAAWLLGVDPPAGGFDGRALSEAFTSRPADTCLSAQAVRAPAAAPKPAPPSPAGGALPQTGSSLVLPGLALALMTGAVLLRGRWNRAAASSVR